ncbi:hypothetical protein BDW22DRAFT_1349099 [Trametopsis cervina]|nr:hypothetical protein BDW22DRAFT_1349099 [Trametopsis cervina]
MSLPVYHKVRIANADPHQRADVADVLDTIHVRKARHDKHGRVVDGRFDTVLVEVGSSRVESHIAQYRVAQVRVVFTLNAKDRELLFADIQDTDAIGTHFAYVEWFTRFSALPNPQHRMYKVSRCYAQNGFRVAEVIPVQKIKCGVQLFPQFGPGLTPREWSSAKMTTICGKLVSDAWGCERRFAINMRTPVFLMNEEDREGGGPEADVGARGCVHVGEKKERVVR